MQTKTLYFILTEIPESIWEDFKRFYQVFILSVLSFSLMCWYESLSERQKGRLNGIVRLCAKIVGSKQVSLGEIYKQRVRVKAGKMRSGPTHVLCKYFVEYSRCTLLITLPNPLETRVIQPSWGSKWDHSYIPLFTFICLHRNKHVGDGLRLW